MHLLNAQEFKLWECNTTILLFQNCYKLPPILNFGCISPRKTFRVWIAFAAVASIITFRHGVSQKSRAFLKIDQEQFEKVISFQWCYISVATQTVALENRYFPIGIDVSIGAMYRYLLRYRHPSGVAAHWYGPKVAPDLGQPREECGSAINHMHCCQIVLKIKNTARCKHTLSCSLATMIIRHFFCFR